MYAVKHSKYSKVYKCKNCGKAILLNYDFCGWQCDVENWIKNIKKAKYGNK